MSLLIELKDIKKIYTRSAHPVEALRGVNFSLQAGEFVSIVGESGSGKSTLVHIIGLLDTPTSGSYYLSGNEVSHLNDEALSLERSRHIGFVFQSFFLLPRLNAVENVALPLLYRNISFNDARESAMLILKKVGIAALYDHKPSELSGGQQQRVAIARALVGGAGLIVADEPTGALDSKTSQGVMDLLIDLNKTEKTTILLITHDAEVSQQCQRVVTIKDGLLFEGKVS